MSQVHPEAQKVLSFWFEQLTPQEWFAGGETLDKTITEKFAALLKSAEKAELFAWRNTAQGRLAEIIVLDQFSRNIYRNTPKAFAQDLLALGLAQEAIAQQLDQELEPQQRTFLYLPYMHSESVQVHVEAVKLYQALGNELNLDYELQHKAIIDRFGRYPHRNAILNRESSAEEIEFLQQPNSSF